MCRPAAAAILACAESTAGIDDAPGSVIPSTSATAVMVDAVPMVMHWPGERAMPSSSSAQARSSISPARRSSQYRHMSLPLPTTRPRQLPGSIGPAGTTSAGRSMLAVPINSAGTVLSQPPSSTAPSTGYERSSSSVSMESRLR